MVSFKLQQMDGEEYARVARPLWAKLLFSRRRMYKSLSTGQLHLVRPGAIHESQLRARQSRACLLYTSPSPRD